MTTQQVKRKLAAILSADVKGYSRLIQEDEQGTVRTLNAYKEIMTGLIQHHRGRVVNAPGDNVLAEFGSVVNAVECAVEIQNELKTRNADLSENRRMEFRIGINLGDVIEDGEQILGDGVNIAARLESLSEAGDISISGAAFDQVKNKLNLGYKYLGEQNVKNIVEPVRVYRVLIEPGITPSRGRGWKKSVLKYWGRIPTALKALATVLIALNAAWQLYTRVLSPPAEVAPEKASTSRKMEVASKEKMAFPLPDKPSIAVLPFVNMSEDPKQEFLCDGMTEAIVTALSKVPRLFAIARNSTFAYKGKSVKVKQVSEELGVRYVLEASVQRSGDRLRITAQLTDALTGGHIWAERYDRDLKDIFTLQDEITFKILAATRVKLTEGEGSLGYEKYFKGKQGLDCYLRVLEGLKYRELVTIEDNNLARRIAEEAIAMCPEVPMAYNLMAAISFNDYWLGFSKSPRDCVEKGIEMAQKALALDDTYADAHATLGALYSLKREYDKAIAEGERAVTLNPNGAYVLVRYASTLVFVGRSEEAIPLFQKAIRLDPYGPGFYYVWLGSALALTGRVEEAASAYKKVLQRAPNHMSAHLNLAALYSTMGREKEARAEAAEALRINPKFSLDYYAKMLPFKDQTEKDKIVGEMRKAGLK